MKRLLFASLIIPVFLFEVESQAQTARAAKSKPPTSSEKIEPIRILSGVMKENRIAVRHSDWINSGKLMFEYRLASARFVDGRLEFSGSLREAGKQKSDSVTAILLSTTARSANPWPGANSPTARERKPSGERGEINEQTQSLYSSVETGSGCELIFLKTTLPGQKSPLQIGVVLAHLDNETGVQINQAICRIVHAMNAGKDATEAVKKLNLLISREQ